MSKSHSFMRDSKGVKKLKKVQDTECRAKTFQILALQEHGNTICRAHWTKEEIQEAFAKRGVNVDVYMQSSEDTGGYDTYTLVNRDHARYDYITGGMQGVQI